MVHLFLDIECRERAYKIQGTSREKAGEPERKIEFEKNREVLLLPELQ